MRRAELADLEAVKRLSAAAYIPAYQAILGTIPKPAIEDYRPRLERGEVWLLELDAEPIGVAVLEETPEHLLIYSIAVKPDRQGRGHGTALLRFAEKRARVIGVSEIRLYTNARMKRNLALYRHFGFIEIGTRPHPTHPGQTLVDMAKQLPS